MEAIITSTNSSIFLYKHECAHLRLVLNRAYFHLTVELAHVPNHNLNYRITYIKFGTRSNNFGSYMS